MLFIGTKNKLYALIKVAEGFSIVTKILPTVI